MRPPSPSRGRTHLHLAAGRAEFARVLNWRNVAAVFYFCVLVVISRTIDELYHQPVGEWAIDVLRFLRQSLISGIVLLATIAIVEFLAASRDWTRRQSLAFGALGVAAGAALATALRFLVYTGSWEIDPALYLLGVWTSWSMVGFFSYSIFCLNREQRQAAERLASAEQDRQTLAAQVVQAHLSALQAQIEPHFLFNTLANVKRLYETAPVRGREMLASLIDYLRAALPSMRLTGSTARRELELARSFLTILQMRMGERLSFRIDADETLLDAAMPPMILPTLVENAIKHGLAPLPEGGRLDICARRRGADLELLVADTGAGIRASGGSGVGLANTRSRLAALYGGRAALSLSAAVPRGVVATLRIPIEPAATPAPDLA
jgi:two-component sensor histidine kinase